MTRKDYEAIAAAIRAEHDAWRIEKPEDDAKMHQAASLTCGYIAQRIAEVMARDNRRFDRARFLKACGVAS